MSTPEGLHMAMPHIKAAQSCLDISSNSAEAMARYAERASAHALVAIAVLLSGMQPCPLEPLPARNGIPFCEKHDAWHVKNAMCLPTEHM